MCKQELLYQAMHPAQVEEVTKIIAAVEDAIAEEVPYKRSIQIQLALEEALVNIASYAYQELAGSEKIVQIKIWRSKENLTIEIIDYGVAYNPLKNEEPQLHFNIENREIGGLGIHFIRSVIDEVVYQRKAMSNVLTLIIKFGEE